MTGIPAQTEMDAESETDVAWLARTGELARAIRLSVVQMTHDARAAHVGSSLSCVDILAVLYSGVANVTPGTAGHSDRDRIIVSKGHAAAAVYAALAHAGFFEVSELGQYCVDGSPLSGHVTATMPGVELSTGSLGHGLPVGLGLAMGLRDAGSRVWVVMSDGECDEGSVWEAAMLAGHHEVSNLTVVIDRNGIQSLAGTEQTVRLEPLREKWQAFGWDAVEVGGHDLPALQRALRAASERPRVVIARTTKGKGVSFMEDQVLWHYRNPDDAALAQAQRELGAFGGQNDA